MKSQFFGYINNLFGTILLIYSFTSCADRLKYCFRHSITSMYAQQVTSMQGAELLENKCFTIRPASTVWYNGMRALVTKFKIDSFPYKMHQGQTSIVIVISASVT